jgi:hypothetical protein
MLYDPNYEMLHLMRIAIPRVFRWEYKVRTMTKRSDGVIILT